MENNPAYLDLIRSHRSEFNNLCGVEFEAVGRGCCRAFCLIKPELTNFYGFVHGGASATLMDAAAGTAAYFSGDEPRSTVTQSANYHFLRPVSGGRMICEAAVIKAGRHTALVRSELRDDAGKLCVVGDFEFFFTDHKRQEAAHESV